uniref:Uncharacterized protein n=1 Tax=Loa loa TaxID=7209 RepID=A0A1I7VR86_LOALO
MSRFPTFDVSRFQKVFSAVTGASIPLSEISASEREVDADMEYDPNRFQSMKGKESNHLQKYYTQYGRRRILKNEGQKVEKIVPNREKWRKYMIGRWIRNGSSKEPRNDVSYEMFGLLPKFDPRFPFDRAFKLMEDLQPPEMFKFPSASFYI